jgi:hypothetical protein
MRYTPAEKMEIIRLVEASGLPVKQTLTELGLFLAEVWVIPNSP